MLVLREWRGCQSYLISRCSGGTIAGYIKGHNRGVSFQKREFE